MSNLYELTDEMQSLQAAFESGEIPEEAFNDTLEGIQMAFDQKAENICKLRANLLSDAAAYKAEKARLSARQTSVENEAKRLQDYLLSALNAAGQKKIKAGTFTASISKSTPALNVYDESLVPDNFYIQLPKVMDNAAIREAIKAGEVVPGAKMEQGEHLTIR